MQADSDSTEHARPTNSKHTLHEGLPRPYRWGVYAVTEGWRTRKIHVNARSAEQAAKLVLEQNEDKGIIGTTLAFCDGRVGETSPARELGIDLEEPGGARYWIPSGDPCEDWWVEVDSYGNKLPGEWEFYEDEGIACCTYVSGEKALRWTRHGDQLERARSSAATKLMQKLEPWDLAITFSMHGLEVGGHTEKELCDLVNEVGGSYGCERVGPNVWHMNHGTKKMSMHPQALLLKLCQDKRFIQSVWHMVYCAERLEYRGGRWVVEREMRDMLGHLLRTQPHLLLEEQEDYGRGANLNLVGGEAP